jgi:hypothetical protein
MSRYFLVAFLLVLLPACTETALHPGEGYIDVEGGRVWYGIGSSDQVPKHRFSYYMADQEPQAITSIR